MRFRLEAVDEFIPSRPPPGGAPSRTVFTQKVYFANGGPTECVAAFDADPV